MRVVILSNNDMTGNLIFSPLFAVSEVRVVSVLLSDSPAKGKKNPMSAALALRCRMDRRYWWFLVLTNGFFSLFSLVTDRLGLSPQFGSLQSLPAHARRAGVAVKATGDFNSAETKALLQSLEPDLLVVRVSAILDRELLAIPHLGTWCVHSSLLPAYGGIAGEFQALREGQLRIGTTVFEVTPKLDDGPPLAQVSLETSPTGSLFSHIVANNIAAGTLLAEMARQLSFGKDPKRPLLNAGLAHSYFSWPKPEQVDEFLSGGRKLISAREALRLAAAALRLGFLSSTVVAR